MRHGEASGLHLLEQKALSVGSGADGGYLVPRRDRGRGDPRRQEHLADPRHRRHPHGVRDRLQEAVRHHRCRDRLGRRDGDAARDQLADARRADLPDHGALRHAGGDPDPARRLRRRISTSGWPRRSASPSPSRRAPPSSPATATTSRRASSATPRSPTARGAGTRSAIIATGNDGTFDERTTRATI